MTAAAPDAPLMSRFLDDYFAECDEHLTSVRRNLLALEAAMGKAPPDKACMEELFRSFHTIKGLSGMVGIREAEQLAHRIESLLGTHRNKTVSLSAEILDALIAAVTLLEKVIVAKRGKKPLPDVYTAAARLAALTSGNGSPPAEPYLSTGRERPTGVVSPPAPAVSGSLPEAGEGTALLWSFEFTPSQELSDRGVNVNHIRSRLEERGKILRAAPRVLPAGGIAFEFLVAFSAAGPPPAAWRDDGLMFHPQTEGKPAGAGPDSPRAPAPEPQAASVATPAAIAPGNIVRVDLVRLDEIMRLVGELVISRARLEDGLGRLTAEASQARLRPLQEANLGMERQLRDLREAVMRIRMVPVGEIFNRMQFVVRDVARENGKEVLLKLEGQETEIDKLIVERMMDPLLHLVRNAIGHGLERPEERRAKGKPVEGLLTLRAATAGDLVILEVEDDGAGLDPEQIAARARSQGLLVDGEALDEQGLLDILCSPGFSTRTEADLTSGRGVGMTVVRNAILALGGALSLETAPERGARFVMRLPLTLAIANALIVSAGGQTFAIPQSLIREVIEIAPESVTGLENNELIPYRGGALPLIRLARFFNLDPRQGRALYGLVVGTGLAGTAIVVDRVTDRREIVVRAMTDPLLQSPGVSGATELGDGRVVLILDAARLTQKL